MIGARLRGTLDADVALPWACVALVLGRLIAIALAYPPGDGDRYWQYWLGERILHEHAIPRALGAETFGGMGAPWIPQEWLFSTALAASIDRGAAWVVPLACALIVGLALGFVVARCRHRGVSAPATSAAVLLCGLATLQSFGVRAQVVSWAGVSALLWLLEAEGPLVWFAVPLTVVWANLHASAFLAPAVAFAFAAAALLRDRCWSRDVTKFATIGSACALATLATPFGLALPRYAAELLSSPIREAISEWMPTSIAAPAFTIGALPLLLLLVAFGVRADLGDRVLAVFFAVFLFAAVRNVPVFAFAVAPIALAVLPLRARVRESTRSERIAAWATVSIIAVASGVLFRLVWTGAPLPESVLPLATARVLMARGGTAPRVLCEDFSWCSIFFAQTKPVTFFMDGRCDPYPPATWQGYLRVLRGKSGWSTVLDAYRVNAVLARRESVLDGLLAARRDDWQMLAADGLARLYVRRATRLRTQRGRSDDAFMLVGARERTGSHPSFVAARRV